MANKDILESVVDPIGQRNRYYKYNSIGSVTSIEDSLWGGTRRITEKLEYMSGTLLKRYSKYDSTSVGISSMTTQADFNTWEYRYSPQGREQKRMLYSPLGDSSTDSHPNIYYQLGASGEMLTVFHGRQTAKDTINSSVRRVYWYENQYLTNGGAVSIMSDSVRKYKITDYAGSTRAEIIYNSNLGITTGISTFDYKPYGDTLDASTNFLPVQTFAGEEKDVESSYMDMGYRTYDPLIGRFLQVDPLNETFPNITPYCYSYNSPMTWSDASGLAPWRIERSSEEVSYTVFNSQLMIHDMDGVHRITGDSFEEWWACLFSDMGGPNGGGFGGGGDFSLDRMGEEAENNAAERQERKEREKAERLAEKAFNEKINREAKEFSEARTRQLEASFMTLGNIKPTMQMNEKEYTGDEIPYTTITFASNSVTTIPANWRPDDNGYITKKESDLWYLIGNGQELKADIGKMNFGSLYVDDFIGAKDNKITWNLFFKNPMSDEAFVYGSLTLQLYENNLIGAYDDSYDFRNDDHSWFQEPLRNIFTIIGRMTHSEGTPFNIILLIKQENKLDILHLNGQILILISRINEIILHQDS